MRMQDSQPKMVDGAPEVVAVILRTQEAEIIDTWQTLGMRGTDSNNVVRVRIPASQPRKFPCVFNNLPHRVISL
jgi:hypothetical protein